MTIRSYFIFPAVLLLMFPLSLRAQNPQSPSTSKGEPPKRQVIGSVSETWIRFTCPGDLIQLRLEVVGPSGEVLFDSAFKAGNVVDWPAADVKGQQTGDGTYLCVVSVKDATGEIVRKQAIATVRDQSVSLRETDKSLLSPAQSASVMTGEDVNVTVVEAGAAPAAILAHDGATAHLVSGRGGLSISSGDFFANKLIEQIRITAEGNVGIGVANPQARLDVAGRIKATEGLVFPDGSVQFSAARRTLGAASLKGGDSQDAMAQGASPDIGGTGTTGKISKWLDGPNGVLNDSNITEASGAIGVNGTPNTAFRLDVNGSTRIRGPNPGFNLEGQRATGNIWLFQTVDNDGRFRLFGQDNVNPGVERLTISLATGNVGIGATSPSSKLEIGGNALIYPASGPGSLHIRNRTTSDFSQIVFDDNNNSYRGYMGYIGSSAGLGARNNTVEFGTQSDDMTFRPNEFELMRLTHAGRVGVGTTSPTHKFEVIQNLSGASALFAENIISGTSGGVGVEGRSINNPGAGVGGRFQGGGRGATGIADATTYTGVATGVEGTASGSAGTRVGLSGDAQVSAGADQGYGLSGQAIGAANYNFGVYGNATGALVENFGVYGTASGGPTNWAGFFLGDTYVDGKLGVGTASPATKLHVSGTGIIRARVNSNDNAGLALALNDQPKWSVATATGGNFQIYNDAIGSNAVWIDTANNNVGIGTTAPEATLHVNGIIHTVFANGGGVAVCRNSSSELSLCSSSLRYKQNIHTFNPGLSLVNRLRPVTFNWKVDNQADLGLVAEEVAAVEPLLVTHNSNGEIEGVKYDRIAVVLLNALKEQQTQLEKYRGQLSQQRAEIAALKRLVCAGHPDAESCKSTPPAELVRKP